jgi:addiction module RelE/StbE family toxin
MKPIKWSHRFKNADALLQVAKILINGEALPPEFHDHPLTGNWKGHRDCHLYPDLVLIRRDEKVNPKWYSFVSVHTANSLTEPISRCEVS